MKYVKIVIIVGIAVLLLFFFFKDVNFVEVKRIVEQINPLYPVLFMLGTLVQFFIRAYRWGIILKPYKQHLALGTLLDFTAIGFFLNLLPGRLGEPARGILLARHEDFKQSYGLASVVVERMIDFLMLILMFLLSLLFIEEGGSPFLAKLKILSLYLLPIILFIFFLFYFLNSPRVFAWVERVLNVAVRVLPQRIRQRVQEFLLNFLSGLKLNLKGWDFVRLFVVSFSVWFFIVIFYWLLMKGFAIQVRLFDTVPYFVILVVFAAVPTPGMTGTIDMGSKMALMQLYGVSKDTAVAYTLLVHVILLAAWIILGLVALWRQGLSLKMLKDIGKKTEK